MNYDDWKCANPWDEDRVSRAVFSNKFKKHKDERHDDNCAPEDNNSIEPEGDDDEPLDNEPS